MRNKRKRPGSRALPVIFVVALAPGAALADEPPAASERSSFVHRLRYDNDLFIARDDAFFAGGFAQERHSPPLTGWDLRPGGTSRRALPRWIGNGVPGLEATGGRVLRFGSGFAHTIHTPDDLRASELQPDDIPYAGTLGAFWSWTAFDDRSLNAFQIYAGVLGPVAGARELHELLHNTLARGPRARGFRWQLENEPLFNVNYALKRKIASPADPALPGWQGDLAVGVQQAVGNYRTATDLQLEFRAGPRLPAGFAQIPDPIGPGIAMEPVVEPGELGAGPRLRFHASVAVRASVLWYSPLLDGTGWRDSLHPGVDYDPVYLSAIAGLHLAYGRVSAHLSYFGSGLAAELGPTTRTTPSWLSVSFDLRR